MGRSVFEDLCLKVFRRGLAREVLAVTIIIAVGGPLVATVAIIATVGAITALFDSRGRREVARDW
jgi:hypothetical protein